MESYESLFGYRPDLTFTLEQHLKNFAECEENARRLLESFHIIREKMEVNLRPVIALFPHYSEHSHEHSEHIIAAVEKLLGTKRIENFPLRIPGCCLSVRICMIWVCWFREKNWKRTGIRRNFKIICRAAPYLRMRRSNGRRTLC